jgi:putative transposase
MTGKTYKSIFYHVVFGTQYHCPFIIEERKHIIYNFINDFCKKNGYYLYCIGGIENHIHLLMYVSPETSIAKAIGKIKGATSYFYNSHYGYNEKLKWQRGYGVFTVSSEHYYKIFNYIRKQVEHHKNKTTIHRYELQTP